jgi:hypothetical protein
MDSTTLYHPLNIMKAIIFRVIFIQVVFLWLTALSVWKNEQKALNKFAVANFFAIYFAKK